jgi:uncharacterized protein
LRVVIDTNVLISALFWVGRPKRLLNLVRFNKIAFITSEPLLTEMKAVCIATNKPFRLSKDEADKIIDHLKDIAAEIVYVKSKVTLCKDEADNRVLECALDGKADYIVTGDKDLLSLKSFKGIKIVKVSDLPI